MMVLWNKIRRLGVLLGGLLGGGRFFVWGMILAIGAVFALISFPEDAVGKSSEELRVEIQEQLLNIGTQLKQLDGEIAKAKVVERALKRELTVLARKIQKLELEIERTLLSIAHTEEEMNAIELRISDLKKQEAHEKSVLAELLRNVDREDDATLFEVALTAGTFSSWWSKLHALDTIQDRIQEEIARIRDARQAQDTAFEEFEGKREEQVALKQLQETQEAELGQEKIVKESMLGNARHQQRALAASVVSNETLQERLQKHLFILEGSGVSLRLEDAVAKARALSEKTGVRPAFLLAVLQKESQWGARVGTGNWRDDMHPRDHAAFLAISKELGLNPDLTPVSRKPSYGWGGAMGPAQFLPTTWLAWKERISELTGHNPPSPWNIDDAFAGAALKLAAAGADQRTAAAERRAAMIYFAGGNWERPAFQFYGDSVMELADMLEEQLRGLEST